MAQMVKNLPTMQETLVRSQCLEGPLETEMATHSSILAWRIPWTEEPVQFMRSQRVGYKRETNIFIFTLNILKPPRLILSIRLKINISRKLGFSPLFPLLDISILIYFSISLLSVVSRIIYSYGEDRC